MRSRVWWPLAIQGSVMVGCSSTPPAETHPVASFTPVATVSSAPVARVDATPTKPASPFFAVTTVPGASHLVRMRDGITLAIDGFDLGPDSPPGIGFARLSGDKLQVHSSFYPNPLYSFVTMDGALDGNADVLITTSTGRVGVAERFVHGPQGWKLKDSNNGREYVDLVDFDKSSIALTVSVTPFGYSSHLETLSGSSTRQLTPVNEQACLDFAKSTPKDAFFHLDSDDKKSEAYQQFVLYYLPKEELTAKGLGASENALFAVGTLCNGDLAVETWRKGSAKSTIQVLGKDGGTLFDRGNTGAVFRGPGDEAWVLGNKVYHFDGTTWSKTSLPALTRGAVTSKGVLWAFDEKGHLYQGDSRSVTEVPIPGDAAVESLAIDADDTVWILAGGALLRTGHPGDGASQVEVKPVPTPPKHEPHFEAGGPSCKHNLVVLYGFTKVTPDDYDFPLSRKALKGHSEFADAKFVVTRDGGQRFFSALTTSFAEAISIAKVIESSVKGSKPQVVCAEPEILREVKFDLGTGEVTK